MKRYIICTLAITLMGLTSCQEKGNLEKAGERMDEVIDNVEHGDAPLKEKGPLEKIGESIDDSVKGTKKK